MTSLHLLCILYMMTDKQNVPRSRELSENCRNHPMLEADGRCGRCWGFFCDACLEEIGGHLYCESCAPAARLKHEAVVAEMEERRRLDLRLLVYVLSGVLGVVIIAFVLYFNGVLDDIFATYVPAYQVTNRTRSLGSKVDGYQTTSTDHFKIYYHSAAVATAVAPLAEQDFAAILKDLLIYEKDVTKRGKFNIIMPADEAELNMLFTDIPPTRIALTDYPTKSIVFIENSDLPAVHRDLSHELTHAIVFERFESASRIPEWLTEGLASYEEAGIDPSQVAARWTTYGPGIAGGGRIPLASLAVTDGSSQEEVNIFYAESYSVVNYMITNYGMLKFMKLLAELESGEDIDSAIDKIYPQELTGLSDLEKKWLAPL